MSSIKIQPTENVCQDSIYKKLFYDNFELLRNFLYSRYGDMQRAEDIAQDSFITLWKNCHNVSITSAKSYLFSVARNATLNVIRNQKSALKYKLQNNNESTNISPEFQLEEKEFMETLTIAIDSLRPKQREAFLLSRVEKYTYNEIAQMLDISQKAVEKRIHLAMIHLKDHIGNFNI